jgi:ubiquinol-cytochrome c reductase subunit 7
MSFHREFAKLLAQKTKQTATSLAKPPKKPVWLDTALEPVNEGVLGGVMKSWRDLNYDLQVSKLRAMGLLFDDCLQGSHPVVKRALELLPYDLRVHRARRIGRASMVLLHHTHLPHAEQNYDPMIPYMAPYLEEAKHQIQEEIELLQFHPWERRLYSGEVSGFGETDKNSTFLAW